MLWRRIGNNARGDGLVLVAEKYERKKLGKEKYFKTNKHNRHLFGTIRIFIPQEKSSLGLWLSPYCNL